MRPLSSELGESNEQIQQLSAKVINTPNSLESFLKVLPSASKRLYFLKTSRFHLKLHI